MLRRGSAIDVAPVPDLRGALGRLRVDGSVLEIGELAAVKAALAAGRAESRRNSSATPSRVPRVAALARARRGSRRSSACSSWRSAMTTSCSIPPARRWPRHAARCTRARERLIRRLEAMLRDADPSAVPGGASVTMRSGRYVIPVRRDSRSRPEGIIHDESGSAGTLFVEPTAAIELGNALRSALSAEERETLIVLRDLTNRLRPERDVDRRAAGHVRSSWIPSSRGPAGRTRPSGEVPDDRHDRRRAAAQRRAPSAAAGARHRRGTVRPVAGGRRTHPADFRAEHRRQDGAAQDRRPGAGAGAGGLRAADRRGQRAAGRFAGCSSISAIISRSPPTSRPFRRTSRRCGACWTRPMPATLILLDEIGSGTDPAEGGALGDGGARNAHGATARSPSRRRISARSRRSPRACPAW